MVIEINCCIIGFNYHSAIVRVIAHYTTWLRDRIEVAGGPSTETSDEVREVDVVVVIIFYYALISVIMAGQDSRGPPILIGPLHLDHVTVARC